MIVVSKLCNVFDAHEYPLLAIKKLNPAEIDDFIVYFNSIGSLLAKHVAELLEGLQDFLSNTDPAKISALNEAAKKNYPQVIKAMEQIIKAKENALTALKLKRHEREYMVLRSALDYCTACIEKRYKEIRNTRQESLLIYWQRSSLINQFTNRTFLF